MNMQFNLSSAKLAKLRSQCIIVGVFHKRQLSRAARDLDTEGALSQRIESGDMDGSRGQSLLLHNVPGTRAERVLLIGCGSRDALSPDAWLAILQGSIRALSTTSAGEAINCLIALPVKGMNLHWKLRQAVLCTAQVLYRFEQMRSSKTRSKRKPPLQTLTFHTGTTRPQSGERRALLEGEAIAQGMKLTRDLANLPANICTPTYLAEQAQALGKAHGTVSTRVLDSADMQKLGMGSLLSVAQGAKAPPKLIVLRYRGRKGRGPEQAPVVLIGKGVTFDTGGISLKPAAAMDEMKFDMCGAASVFGTLQAAAQMRLPMNVIGLVPATENMPGSQATRPGDIVTSMSGRTIEILNTDAEGRLILCDALSYAARYKPATVIDIATLTGACIIALGRHASGMLSNDKALARDLLRAGERSRDRVWQLPLWEEYQQQLQSPFADVANIGGREAGTITAACFLWHFARQYKWAHLDIAGTAWRSGKQKGATGRPVALLCHYLLQRCA